MLKLVTFLFNTQHLPTKIHLSAPSFGVELHWPGTCSEPPGAAAAVGGRHGRRGDHVGVVHRGGRLHGVLDDVYGRRRHLLLGK